MPGNKDYEVQFEIAGPAAMFTRPDTGAAPVSYPVPTYSAARGMFDSIARLKSAYIRPTMVDICSPIRFQRYTTNYGGPLRKGNQIAGGSPYQLIATILIDVCFRVYGVVEELYRPSEVQKNHLHHLQEFTPSYFGSFREGTRVEESIHDTIPSMLFSVFSCDEEYRPVFKQNVQIVCGRLEYVE